MIDGCAASWLVSHLIESRSDRRDLCAEHLCVDQMAAVGECVWLNSVTLHVCRGAAVARQRQRGQFAAGGWREDGSAELG